MAHRNQTDSTLSNGWRAGATMVPLGGHREHPLRSWCAALFAGLALMACDGGFEETPGETHTPAAAPVPGAVGHGPARRSPVSVQAVAGVHVTSGRLTLRVQQMDLGTVLDAVSRQAGIPIEAEPAVRARRVSADVNHVPLAAGLMTLLQDFDAVLVVGAGQAGSTGTLQAAWVFARGTGPARANAVMASLTQPARPNGPVVLPAAVSEAHADIVPARAGDQQQIAADIVSPDAQVRHLALSRSLTQQLPLPESALRRLASEDPEPRVRALAITAWAQDAQAEPQALRAALQQAVQDSHPALRDRAREILQQLDMAALSNEAAWLPDSAEPAPPPP